VTTIATDATGPSASVASVPASSDHPESSAMRSFDAAQRVLGEPDRKKAAPGAVKYLLSGIAAAPCGRTVPAPRP
jgi:hypothetical protein